MRRISSIPRFCLLAACLLGCDVALADAPKPDTAPEQSVSAGPIQASLKLDRASLNVAQSLTATLTVRAPVGVRVTLPEEEAKLDGFSVVSIVNEPLRTLPTGSGQEQLLVRRYKLAPFLPGEYKIPPMEIRWQKSEKESGVARTAEVKVVVDSLLPKSDAPNSKALDPGTIRAEYTLPAQSDRSTLWVGFAVGFGAAVALGAGFWILNRRRTPKDDLEALIAQVEALRRQGTFTAESLHQLASAFRRGLATRLDPSAGSQTTGELVATLARTPDWGEAEARRAGDVFETLDAARFGGTSMSEDRFRNLAETVASMLARLRAMPPRAVRTEVAP